MAEDDKLGTTDEQAADAGKPDAQGGSEAGRGGLSAEDQAALNLSLKLNAEEARRRAEMLEAEIERMRAQQSPAADASLDPVKRRRAAVEGWAGKNDDVAAYVLDLERRLEEQLQQNTMNQEFTRQLDRIPDQNTRDRVRKEFEQNRHLYGSPDVAREVIEGRERATEIERLRKQVEDRNRQKEEALKSAPPTHTRGEPRASTNGETVKKTFAEFDAEVENLEAEGRFKEALALRGRAANGEIDLVR